MAVMCDTAGNKHHICIRDNLFNCPQTQQHIHLKVKKNTYSSVLIRKCFLWKETSTYWKFKDNIFDLF